MKEELDIAKFAESKGMSPIWLKRLSFTSILVSSNLVETLMTKTLGELTSKQWLLLTIASSLPEPPSLSEVGSYMGCSRQNVKQIAKKLHEKRYVEFTKIEGDKNTIRLVATESWKAYCIENEALTAGILDEIFNGFEEEELTQYFRSFNKLMENIEEINGRL